MNLPVPRLPSADIGPTGMVPEHPGHFGATTQPSPLLGAGSFFHPSQVESHLLI